MRARTVSAIYLQPTENTQDSFYYYILWTGCRLIRKRRTPLPMPQDVIDQIHYIAERQNNPPGLAFTRQDGNPYESDGDDKSVDEDYGAPDPVEDAEIEQPAEIEGVENAEIEGVDVNDDDEDIDGEVEVLPPPPTMDPQVVNVDRDEPIEEEEGAIDDDAPRDLEDDNENMEQAAHAAPAGVRRPG